MHSQAFLEHLWRGRHCAGHCDKLALYPSKCSLHTSSTGIVWVLVRHASRPGTELCFYQIPRQLICTAKFAERCMRAAVLNAGSPLKSLEKLLKLEMPVPHPPHPALRFWFNWLQTTLPTAGIHLCGQGQELCTPTGHARLQLSQSCLSSGRSALNLEKRELEGSLLFQGCWDAILGYVLQRDL